MIFESLWPLFFLAAVPVIIILYLLKPKGVDQLISSNLLWQKLLKNQQSRTFFEKFVHNILMYLQILIVVLLVIALMSPFIRVDGHSGERKILLLDTSGSMQHVDALGKSRLEEAVEQACDYVRTAKNCRFSLVTVDAAGVKLLAVDSSDTDGLIKTLKSLECSDSGGSLTAAQGILDTLAQDEAKDGADLVVYTDGAGAADFEQLQSKAEKELYVVGEPTSNVANEYTVFAGRKDGLYDVMVSMTNYSDGEASFDVGLYDDGERLIALSREHLAPLETKVCLFEGIDWQGESLSSRLSGISFSGLFDGPNGDSLAKDNVSEAVKSRTNLIRGLYVGDGNTFIEKAYRAVTGENISKAESDAVVESGSYNVVIYDADRAPGADAGNRLIFGDAGQESVETLKNVVLDMTDCGLSSGLSGFTIGVNTAYCFELPKGAESFLEYDGKCVGYYGERDGRKEIVVGFDIRESDFPLRAEFPVFLANAMIYLTDTSWLATNVYYAGEEIALQPWAEPDREEFESRPGKAGLYRVGNETYKEPYVVRFQTFTESEGRTQAASVKSGGEIKLKKAKQTLRNVFLLLALMLLAAEWIVYVRQTRYRGKFYPVIRGMVFLCVLLSLLGLKIRMGSSRTATVFMVDLSGSNEEHLEEMEDYLRKCVDRMPADNVYGIVTFGGNTLVEQSLTSEKYYGGLMTVPEKTATNFEEALSRALMLIPKDAGGRLVVLTDGKETGGDIRNMAGALTAGGTEFLTLLYEDEETPDAYIDQVTLPAYLHPGDKYSITVLVESNYDTDADILLYNGSRQAADSRVHLNKGSNRFVFSEKVISDGDGNAMESLKVQVKAEGDTCPENDSYSAYSVVEAAPWVLVISDGDSNVSDFTSCLNAAGCDYSAVSALNAPDSIQTMLEYKAIILVDTYIDDLPAGFLENLETYVKDYGCGFICCGGEDSYALGGYRDTVLETVLPVDMELRSVNEIPSMAMVMVIDRSGSMTGAMEGSGVSNLDVAIKAALVAVDSLRDSDYVGVLTFDDGYEWQVELTRADDRPDIKDRIGGIRDGGGTTIKPALQEAFRVLSESDASVKHVVLLTDGMGETTDFSDVVENYTDSGITLSAVAVGDGSDTKLLEHLADSCKGRYYYSDASSDIPRIFAQEVFLGGDSYIQNGEFLLSVQGGHELTANLFTEGWPMLYGYVSATPKTASSPVIVSRKKDDPILTVWQYGLGRTVAWNSDVTGEWSGPFVGQEDYVKLWKRIVDYSTGNADMGEDRVDVVTVGGTTQIVYQASDYDSQTAVLTTVIDPEGGAEEVKLYAAAPGRYEAEIPTPQTGLYHFNLRRMQGEEIISYMTTAAAVQFSYEYKFDVSTAAYLDFVQQYGRLITPKEEIWTHIDNGSGERRSLTNWLLGLAICLFLMDVAMRRFEYVPRWRVYGGGSKGQERDQDDDGKDRKEAKKTKENFDGKQGENFDGKPGGKFDGKPGETQQALDTSELLKKKDNRNI